MISKIHIFSHIKGHVLNKKKKKIDLEVVMKKKRYVFVPTFVMIKIQISL